MTNKELPCANKKLRNKVFLRWMFASSTSWNYEKMMANGYCFAMLPALKEIYSDNSEELKVAVKNHLQFFNSTPQMCGIILGVNLAVEEQMKSNGKELISSIKTGLMGPIAGVGDSIFGVIIPTILGAIAANMAMEGNIFGWLIWLAVNLFVIPCIRYALFEMGYKEGQDVVKHIGTSIKKIVESANVLGLTVVGALIPSVINLKIPYVFKMDSLEMSLQTDVLDKIMPNLLPLITVSLIYFLISSKKISSSKVILLVVIVSIILSFLGILG